MNLQVAAGPLPSAYLATSSQTLQACQAGDEEAWKQVLDTYGRLVYSVPLHYGLSREEAAHITQIVFTALLQSLNTLHNSSNLGGWLVLVARRHSWRLLRNQQQAAGFAVNEASLTTLVADWSASRELTVLPSAVEGSLLQRFSDYVQFRQQPASFQRRHAALTFDSLHQPVPAGLRAGVYEATRQYTYGIDLTDLALNVQSSWYGERLDLIGQILPNTLGLAADGFIVQLLHYEQETAITLADTIGTFWFEALEPGPYALLLSTDALEIEVPTFALAYE